MSPPSSPTDEDKFISGIYNYCDGWCSACTLSTRCRIKAEIDAQPPGRTPDALAAQIRGWFQRAVHLTHEEARLLGVDVGQLLQGRPEESTSLVSLDHARLLSRAKAYHAAVFAWQKERPVDSDRTYSDPTFPPDVIDQLAFILGSKVKRALTGRVFEEQDAHRDPSSPKDSDGSAKVAILAAERSRAAWSDLRDSGLVSNEGVQDFEDSLTWLIGELERVFPNARSFVRPGFDE